MITLELGKSYERKDGVKVTMGALPAFDNIPHYPARAAFWVQGVGYYDADGTYSGLNPTSLYHIKGPWPAPTPLEAAIKIVKEAGLEVVAPKPDPFLLELGWSDMKVQVDEPVVFKDEEGRTPLSEETADKLMNALIQRREWRSKWLTKS